MTPDPVDLVLTDYDLLRVIVANLQSEGKAAELVGCTHVCYAFYEAAVEALWSKLNTITPLWHLLASPESQSSYHKYTTGQEEEYLRSILSAKLYDVPQVFSRFLKHANRVRVLKYSFSRTTFYLHAQLARIVLDRNAGEGIFPGLHTLRCATPLNSFDDMYTLPLCTAALADISVSLRLSMFTKPDGSRVLCGCASTDDIINLCRGLRHTSPALTSIAFNAPLDQVATRALKQFPHLKAIHKVFVYSLPVFIDLVTQPGITSLDLRCDNLVIEPVEATKLPQTLRSVI